MGHRPLLATAALLSLACMAPVPTARAEEQKKGEPVGILFVAGDIVTCEKDAIRSGQATADVILEGIKEAEKFHPNTEVGVLALGDLSYPSGADFKCFNKSWGRFKNRILPVPGNHDYQTKKAKAYFDYFKPTLSALKADKLATYALDFPRTKKLGPEQKPWRLFALNSNTSTGSGSQQVKWLEAELAKVKGKQCVLAFAHAFFYSSGRHGHDDGTGQPQNSVIDVGKPLLPSKEMRAMFEALYANRASVFVAGHDHHNEQLGRANASGKPADKGAAAAATNGVRSFVVGTGGKRLYSDDYTDKWAFSEAIGLQSYGVLRLTLYSTSYAWEFVPIEGNKGSIAVTTKKNSDDCNLAP